MNKLAFLTTVFPMNHIHLKEMLDSLVNQSVRDFDLIIVNDGLEGLLDLFDEHLKHLNVIELKSVGNPIKNRQDGINYCIDMGYDILLFGDSDDVFSLNRVEQSISLLKTFDIVVNDLTLFNEEGVLEDKYISNRLENNEKIYFDYIVNKNIFGLSNTAIKLTGAKFVELPTDLIAADWYIFSMLLLEGKNAIFTNETITYYRQHVKNLVGLNRIDRKSFYFGLKVKEIHYKSLKVLTNKIDLQYKIYCENSRSFEMTSDLLYPLWWELI
jgi:glycosyltransferase involved in cell wall biosynthesis